jgi:hypothetical protein
MKIKTKQPLTLVIQAGEIVNVTDSQYQSIKQFVEVVEENNEEVAVEVAEENNEKEVVEEIVKKSSRKVKKTETVKE